MVMQPMMQPEQNREPLMSADLERALDALTASAAQVRALAGSDKAVIDLMHARVLEDVLPILLGPAGRRCTACGGSGRA